MNHKKWQGVACLLLASLMMSSTWAAPVRKEVPSQTSPKKVETPQEQAKPKATVMPPKAVETPKATEIPAPKKIEIPKSVQTPKVTAPVPKETPKAVTPTPKPTEVPKAVTPAPKATETPKTVTPVPKPTEVPKAVTPPCPKPVAPPKEKEPKPAPCPKQSEMPKATEAPKKKEDSPCKKVCPSKPFTLDHFKMIVNTLKKMGVEENEIVTYIKEGKKLEDILTAEKISPKKFKKCITKEYFKVVDEAQKSGQITCEQAKQLKVAIKETIKNWLPKK